MDRGLWHYTGGGDQNHPQEKEMQKGCSPSNSSVHGIFQARILEWVAISFSGGSSWPRDPRDWTQVSHIAGRFFTICATREALTWGKSALKSFSQESDFWRVLKWRPVGVGETRQNNHTWLKISHTQGHFSQLGLTLRLGPFFIQCIICGTQINMYYM